METGIVIRQPTFIDAHAGRLEECDKQIDYQLKAMEQGIIAGFEAIVPVLEEIRDKKLWAPKYRSFDAYCKDRFERSPQWIRRSITHASVKKRLQSLPAGTVLPNERQAREIARLPEDQQAEVWAEVVEEAGGKAPASRVIAEKVDRISGGTDFDVDEIEAYQAPKNGSVKANTREQNEAVKTLDALGRHLKRLGLYDRWLDNLSELRIEIKGLTPP